jgi:hypothetical protein
MDLFRTTGEQVLFSYLISTKIQASSTFLTPENSMKNTVVRPISRLHFKTGSSRQVLTRGVADHRCSCRAASRSALPRLHAGFLAPCTHTSARARAPCFGGFVAGRNALTRTPVACARCPRARAVCPTHACQRMSRRLAQRTAALACGCPRARAVCPVKTSRKVPSSRALVP